ncbi:protoporphyrinogen oxidase [Paenibacillus selenitireducens]|uniref:Protoporphyrinogen oxidase n=2 Tax=Paenibacillus selenitireducens TaxID=1324314 RepID=A0A1T2XBH9_9BACL|nr:protoporphyrinogen oxidase [Paenibacillus selenitireducens]
MIAKIFGVTSKRVQQLAADGTIETIDTPKGRRYDLIPTVQMYITHLADKANGREKKEKDSDLETLKLEAETKNKIAKSRMVELELAELEGSMHRAEDVESVLTDHIMLVRSMLMAMPGKLAVDLSKSKTATEASERIKREVYQIMGYLAEYKYDPDEFKKRVRERQGWSERHGERENE